jgi:hypothetical protein
MARQLALVLTLAAAGTAALLAFAAPSNEALAVIKHSALGVTATNGATAVPPPPNDYFKTYGHIMATTTEPDHPIRFMAPSTDVGQVKIPTDEEIMMRQKLEVLASMSDADIRAELEKWPAYGKMSLSDEGLFLARIQLFKDQRAHLAEASAKQNGLILNPAQQAKYEQDYWTKRLAMDANLTKQIGPIVRAAEQKMQEDLFREFSTAPPPPLPRKPPAPKVPAMAGQ